MLHWVAGISLIFLMLLTIADVVLRAFHRPIVGTYELVGYAGALAVAGAMPCTSWMRGQVYVDFLLGRFSRRGRLVCQLATRLMVTALFVLLGWHLVKFGLDLRASGEVSPTLELKFYPVVFGFAAACALQVIVHGCEIVKLFRGEYE
jgi:TRAP-type C4-dicarboxylate transport system permease small subunit